MKFITGSDFNNTRISCQENLDLWILLFASGELVSLFCTLSLILRSQCCRDQKPRKDLFQIKKSFWNGSLINMQELCCPWIQPIKILQSYVKEPVALKVSVRERKIRLFLPRRKNLFNPYYCLLRFQSRSPAGPSVLRNFNPGIFGTGFLQNPGIPGFSGTGLTYFFHPGIDGIPGFFGTGLA